MPCEHADSLCNDQTLFEVVMEKAQVLWKPSTPAPNSDLGVFLAYEGKIHDLTYII